MTEVPIMVMPWHRPDPCKPSRMQTDAAFKPSHLDYLSSLSLDSPPLPISLTAVIATIGHASNNVDTMVDLMKHGMTMALVPLALGVRQDHINTVARLRAANTAFSQALGRIYPLGIVVQTRGPGIRIGGLIKDIPVDLPLKHRVTLTTDRAWRTKCTEHFLFVGYPELPDVLRPGDLVLLGNGTVIVRVEIVDGNEVVCEVVGGGVVHSCMSVSIPDVPLRLPSLTEEDQDDIRLVASLGVDVVVASRTQNADHIREIRQVLAEEDGGSGIKVWAQLESRQALDDLESILEEADAVLLSRVSLVRDMAPEKLFVAQKVVIAAANKAGVPVLVSSHFLPSMQADATPPIAELNDVAAAILDGADGFVLRNTTSVGRHPEAAVRALVDQAVEAEAAVWHHQVFHYLNNNAVPPIDPTHAIAISAVEAALKASAAAILLATTSGRSAQLVSRYRPRCPIVAVTRYGQVARQLNTWRAVVPLQYVDPPLPDWTREVDVRLQFAIEFAKQIGIVKPGDSLVLLNGWRQGAGFTNTIRVVYASESFPWVYPHQLRSSWVPSDRDVSEQDTQLSPSPSRPSASDKVPSKVTSTGASHHTRLSKAGSLGSHEIGRYSSSLQESVQRSMEAEFKQIVDVRSKEFEQMSLSEEFHKSKADTVGRTGTVASLRTMTKQSSPVEEHPAEAALLEEQPEVQSAAAVEVRSSQGSRADRQVVESPLESPEEPLRSQQDVHELS